MLTPRLVRLLWVHVVRQVLTWSGAWWFAFALAAGQLLPPLIGLAVWRSVFPDSSYISTYYLAMLFAVATTVSYENHTFSQTIYKGTLSDELLKPQPVVIAPLGTNIAIRAWITMFSVPVVFIVAMAVAVHFNAADLVVAIPVWLGAGLLRFLFTWCLAMTAFWTQRAHAITGFGTTLTYMLGGIAVPVALLPSGWSHLARYMPFYSMVGLPADAAAGQVAGTVLWGMTVQLGWLLVTGVLAVALWRSGRARFTAVGR